MVIPNHLDSLIALRRIAFQSDLMLEEKIKALMPGHEIKQNFSDSLEFIGYSIDRKRAYSGSELNISYFWSSLKRMRSNYSIFVHFRKDGITVFQKDYSPSLQTNKWKIGGVVREDYKVKIPSDASSGKYDIIIGLWDPEGTKERVKLKGQKTDEIKMGEIEISKK